MGDGAAPLPDTVDKPSGIKGGDIRPSAGADYHVYSSPRKVIAGFPNRELTAGHKRSLDRAIRRTGREYGEVLLKLGNG